MALKGLIRLWLVVTLIGVPAMTIRDYSKASRLWGDINQSIYDQCARDAEAVGDYNPHGDCIHSRGGYKNVYQHENETAVSWWAKGLGLFFLVDLVLTGLLVAGFLVLRWVMRGFRQKPE
ncbi:hypothetical protein SAMN05192583_0091 [Sphingomonas gellani]|uniref:Uncharacterized protein n=2 Tax=Sphingomonas gellani TaxID=1166340 RepID=A0A1H7Y4U9_9SPHN|nr:hypothetical protein SAMN05192583_0091 [Sphingomonas gellani]